MRGFDIPQPVAVLIAELREVDGLTLKGKTQSAFYRKSKPFLHFHWNDEEIVADVRFDGPDFTRVPVNTAAERKRLIRDVRAFVAGASK
ncbi:MAG: hypothetical protein QOI61_588 [Actinomycetota bacterium]